VRRILGEAGYRDISLDRCDLSLDIAIGRGLEGAVDTATQLGPANRALEGHPPEVRAAATDSVRELLAPLVRGQALPLPGSIWVVAARA
jgi:hypothetical protein